MHSSSNLEKENVELIDLVSPSPPNLIETKSIPLEPILKKIKGGSFLINADDDFDDTANDWILAELANNKTEPANSQREATPMPPIKQIKQEIEQPAEEFEEAILVPIKQEVFDDEFAEEYIDYKRESVEKDEAPLADLLKLPSAVE
jgi:hypothetical protein